MTSLLFPREVDEVDEARVSSIVLETVESTV